LDIHVGEKGFVGDFRKRRRLTLAAHGGGAIDENIDSPERPEHLGYGSLYGGIIAGVSDESLHTALRCPRDVRGGGFEYGAIPRNQGDIRPLCCELPSDSLTDAAVAAGNDGDLIPEFQVQYLLPFTEASSRRGMPALLQFIGCAEMTPHNRVDTAPYQ